MSKRKIISDRNETVEALLRGLSKSKSDKLSDRDKLVVENHLFAVTVANRYQGMGVPQEDLVIVGLMGMLDAAKNYDPGRGVPFVGYAEQYIRNAIIREIKAHGCVISLPDTARITEKTNAAGEVEEESDLIYPIRLDVVIREENSETPLCRLTDRLAKSPDEGLMGEGVHQHIQHALNQLSLRERNVLIYLFGLDGYSLSTGERYTGGRQSVEVTAAEMRVSCETIRLIKEKALAQIREKGLLSQLSQISR